MKKQILEALQSIPEFATLKFDILNKLTDLLSIHKYPENTQIVTQGEIGNSIHIIINGFAEVIRYETDKGQTLLSTLSEGDIIGVGKETIIPTQWQRNATIVAIIPTTTLKLEAKAYLDFIHNYPELKIIIQNIIERIALHNFIQNIGSFSHLSHEQTRWLIDHLKKIHVEPNKTILNQGDDGDTCYFIRSGMVEVSLKNEDQPERTITILKPGALFGEMALLGMTKRNASVKSLEACELLELHQDDLKHILEENLNITKSLLSLQRCRSRPKAKRNIKEFNRTASDGIDITILKDPKNLTYFQLSPLGNLIWEKLDGKHTLQDLVGILFKEYHIFSPNLVSNTVLALVQGGFAKAPGLKLYRPTFKGPIIRTSLVKLKHALEFRLSIKNVDQKLQNIYNRWAKFFYSKPAQIIYPIICLIGLTLFTLQSSNAVTTFKNTEAFYLFFLYIMPLGIVSVMLHEGAHAMTTVYYGRTVNKAGIGWYWLGPIAFVDTSDMWISSRWPRIMVNLAGSYVDAIVASTVAIISFFIKNDFAQTALWIFSMSTYMAIFFNANPFIEFDGYYVLIDLLERPNLRASGAIWIAEILPKSITNPSLFKEHIAEATYWVVSIIYFILSALISIMMYEVFLKHIVPATILGIPRHSFRWLLLVVILALSVVTVIAEVKQLRSKQ